MEANVFENKYVIILNMLIKSQILAPNGDDFEMMK